MIQEKRGTGAARKMCIFLVDDYAIVRYGLAHLIGGDEDLFVCGEAGDCPTAVSTIGKALPDLIISEVTFKAGSGLDFIKNISVLYPKIPLLALSFQDEAIYAELALQAGALGYVMKTADVEQIRSAIFRVLAGEIYVSDRVAAKILKQKSRGRIDLEVSPVERLSDREMEVFQLFGQWKSTRQIAGDLNLSVKTVEYYREQIKKKLSLRDASELVHYATSWVQRQPTPA
jgi:DNA-binding NarL/FixJ family response regulator